MNSILKSCIFVACSYCLWACSNAYSEKELENVEQDIDSEFGAGALGYGFDTYRGSFVQSCIRGYDSNSVSYEGTFQTTKYFDAPLDSEASQAIIGLSQDDPLPTIIGGKATKRVAIAAFATETPWTRNLVFGSVTRGVKARLKDPQLNSLAIEIADSANPSVIRGTCGDHFVSEVDLGSHFLIVARLELSSKDLFSDFSHRYHPESWSLDQLKNNIKGLLDQYPGNIIIKLAAYQEGGSQDPILGLQSDDPLVMTCDAINLSECVDRLDKLGRYGQGAYQQQLTNLEQTPLKANSAAFIKLHTKAYHDASITGLYINPSPALDPAVSQVRGDLTKSYVRHSADLSRANGLLKLTDEPADRLLISSMMKAIETNLLLIADTLDHCFADIHSCHSIKLELLLQPYSMLMLQKTLALEDYCQLETLTAAMAHTMKQIQRELSATDSMPCPDLAIALKAQKSLDLSGKEIEDLRPLSRLPQLKHLNLSDNQIVDLEPLRSSANIETLNLRGNLIARLGPLKHMEKLISLDLAYNELVDLEPLRQLSKLEELKLQGNRAQIFDWSPAASLNLRVFYKSLDHICEVERQYALVSGLAHSSEVKYHESINFAPLYTEPQERSSGIAIWVNCNALESFY
ncbi:leucine-rich repeat domain-containing protein [Pseudobacteriovorax antillogorgiicola]|uniref:Leucine Rich repeat-containing protein n=1 Tax=Pseudobacteriovorax antillogorgiicola TaxID=1513793 RepID=A0A1Y6BDA3_9BACT|nr:leucine-rich repeat domain-containing protein [Pseudobacteriovorax antillogorgiicola]TCS57275.1 leucine rich repeat (LRR) protein [Pseudobacteriovorax antillogorgiicola]SMF03191.1 Leucine Rich repeat-containing protein [Pseudobacteriovorax antillogorgiicola]